jgi:hypothetical protein
MLEDREPIVPPEIHETRERFRVVEFFVDLADPRPELQMLELIRAWLGEQSPLTIHSISFSYQPHTEIDPSLLVAQLILGQPLDLG